MIVPPTILVLAALLAAAPPQGPAAAPPAPAEAPASTDRPAPDPKSVDFDASIADAKRLLDAGDAAGAVARYEEAIAARPDSAEARYNLGVALYRAGRYQDAAAAFARAGDASSRDTGGDAGLAASSLYNRAASFYAGTREQAAAAQRMLDAQKGSTGAADAAPAPIDTQKIDQAIKDARQSLQGFKDAAIANPADVAARANAEQSGRLVRALEELKKQQQQQQQKNDQQKQDSQEKQDDTQDQQQQQQQQQSQQQQKQDGKQDKDQQKKDDSQQQQQQQQQEGSQSKDKEQEQKQQSDQQSKPDQSKDQQQPQPQPDQKKDDPKKDQGQQPNAQDQKEQDQQPSGDRDATPARPAGESPEMTKDEANRLLQSVRDRERKRREEQRVRDERRAAGRPPAKDW